MTWIDSVLDLGEFWDIKVALYCIEKISVATPILFEGYSCIGENSSNDA